MRYGNYYGSYQLDDLPGCSQVCVSHSSFIKPRHRGGGHGSAEHSNRLDKIQELGYDLAICTVAADNIAQHKILISHGWEKATTFKSSKTEHSVVLYFRRINHEGIP